MEEELAGVETGYVMKNILTTRYTGPPIFPKGEYGTGFNPNTPDDLPSWLTQQDLDYYVAKNWELTAPWSGVGISNKIGVRFIIGELDLVYNSSDVPNLEQIFVQKGVAHFNNQEAPQDVTNLIYHFIQQF
ncbi:epoxide hydrolase [Senna tora]|uniref:Epoxide hydrolase n=1 Tax=Senna tora TaxID=362788 RepID=A0A834TBB5_9FABA|nr:epoxide hydrolase [Senna tora]